jgi:membrane fusion protein (multidrug efflux system)
MIILRRGTLLRSTECRIGAKSKAYGLSKRLPAAVLRCNRRVVSRGQPLYQIDPSLYRAARQPGVGQPRQRAAPMPRRPGSRPTATSRSPRSRRWRSRIIPTPWPQARQAAAGGRAEPRRARNRADQSALHHVPAPITGRIGRSLFTEGALVTTNQTDPLATIQRLDPIYVDIQQSSADCSSCAARSPRRRMRRRQRRRCAEAGGRQRLSAMPARRILRSDGRSDDRHGDAARALPQSAGLLLPGMFVRASLRPGDRQQGLPGAAAGGVARSQGQCDRLRRRARQQGGPRTVTRPARDRHQLGGDRRPQPRRQGDRPGRRAR